MADISAQAPFDMGNLLTSFPRNQATIENTQANTAFEQGPQTQATQAQAGLAGAQTGLVQQQTQKAAFELAMIKKAMAGLDNIGGNSEASGEQAKADPTETGVASTLNQKMYVDKMGPQGLQSYINATAWVNPAEAQRAEEWRKTLVEAQTSKNQNEANDIFQTSQALSNTDHPLQSLLSLKPGSYLNNVGSAIASDQTKSPEEKDIAAKTAIQAAAKYSHQYTGRDTEIVGDQVRDKLTKFPVSAPNSTPTPGEQLGSAQWANTPQSVTIGNRTSTVKPADLGIHGAQDLLNNKNMKFSTPPPTPGQPGQAPSGPATPNAPGATPGAPGGAGQAPPTKPLTPGQARVLPSSQGGAPIPGLAPPQSDFVKSLPPAFPAVQGNSTLNADDLKQRDIYREQAKKLSDATGVESTRAQDSITQIGRINALMNTPGLTFGPGSHEYSQLRTVLENWTGTPAGSAGAYQILSKVLNASEMNDLLTQFHSEGAQVRLGAYESRLIMEKLAANPNLTKGAIQQMLAWQASDAKYTMDKAKVAGAALQTGKNVANFETSYAAQFPKQDLVDNTLSVLNPKSGPNFDKTKGKTYTDAQASEAAAHWGIPKAMFIDKLTKAGATVK